MAKIGLLDLEKQLAFHLAYHSNPINIWIHILFVWPLFYTTLMLFYFTPTLIQCPFELPLGLVLNFGFFFTLTYVVLYVLLDKKAGSLAAFICLCCWVSASVLSNQAGYSLAWKIVLAAQLFCWSTQIIGHRVFEKRSPSVVANLLQALFMVPFLVFLDTLHSFFGYEPYPGFYASVKVKIEDEKKKWKDSPAKKVL